jgi:hypothetical protein
LSKTTVTYRNVGNNENRVISIDNSEEALAFVADLTKSKDFDVVDITTAPTPEVTVDSVRAALLNYYHPDMEKTKRSPLSEFGHQIRRWKEAELSVGHAESIKVESDLKKNYLTVYFSVGKKAFSLMGFVVTHANGFSVDWNNALNLFEERVLKNNVFLAEEIHY